MLVFKFLYMNYAFNESVTEPKKIHDREFKKWFTNNVYEHRIKHLKAVLVPAKGTERAPGDLTSEEMYKLADIADDEEIEQWEEEQSEIFSQRNFVYASQT